MVRRDAIYMSYSQALFLYTAIVKLFDALTVLGVWYGCWFLRFDSALFPIPKGIPNVEDYSRVSLPLMLVFCAVFHVVGAYRRDRIAFGFRSMKKVVQGSMMSTLIFIAVCYFRGALHYSRIYLVIFSIAVLLALTLERALLQTLWRSLQKSIIRRIRVLLVGSGNLLEMYVARMEEKKPYPVEWVGRIGAPEAQGMLSRIKYFGREGNLSGALADQRIDQVVVSYPTESHHHYEPLLRMLSNELVAVKVIPDFGRYNTFTYSAGDEWGIPLLHFNQTHVGSTDHFLKRSTDIVGSLFYLILFAPLYGLTAVLIKLTSKGPVLYSQERVGADGKHFILYKFRTMRVGAENTTGAVWAVPNDPRTTKLGRWLRRTSLDEIPQFFNVLQGDMSLVGPRPERPPFVERFRKEVPKYMLRHKMKSGITGWAQVNGWRGNTSIEERIKCDLYYIGHWSHTLDFKIMAMTLMKGFFHRHAY